MSESHPDRPNISFEEVDERTSSWEVSRSIYRVYIHGLNEEGEIDTTVTYDISGADVLQALDWAQKRAGIGHAWALALVTKQPNGDGHLVPGLVWLVGMDGQDSPWDPWEEQVKRRMMQRVGAPIGLSSFDVVLED